MYNFSLPDVDGNGVWDADEVKALFIKELDKLYGPGGPNKDLHERAEEMERMREHVFKENDRNRDGLIDFNEFMLETQKAEFTQDEGLFWVFVEPVIFIALSQFFYNDEYFYKMVFLQNDCFWNNSKYGVAKLVLHTRPLNKWLCLS